MKAYKMAYALHVMLMKVIILSIVEDLMILLIAIKV